VLATERTKNTQSTATSAITYRSVLKSVNADLLV